MSGGRNDLRFASGLVAIWCAVLALSAVAAGDEVLPGDLRIARWVQSWGGPVADAVAAYGNWIGHYWIGVAISLPVLVGLAWQRRRREIALLLAILLVRALSNPIKGLIDSPRPDPDLLQVTDRAHGLGYPSGHASGTLLLFGALILIGPRLRLTGTLQSGLWIVGAGTIFASGFGRIYTGVHWPSDVVGGWLFGLAVLLTLGAMLRLLGPVASRGQPAAGVVADDRFTEYSDIMEASQPRAGRRMRRPYDGGLIAPLQTLDRDR